MSSESLSAHLAKRINFESYGSKERPHKPHSGQMVFDAKIRDSLRIDFPQNDNDIHLDSIIFSRKECALLETLGGNPNFATLATEWSPNSTDFTNIPLVTHATSGSETNGKELLQLLAAGTILNDVMENSSTHKRTVGASYLIDTASHPVSDLFNTEAEMLALVTGNNIEKTTKQYRELFKGSINVDYIEDYIQAFRDHDASPALIQQLQLNWQARCEKLEVPADAINLPDLDDYLAFLSKMDMHPDISKFISTAYGHIESHNITPTIGSLRCLLFSQIGEKLAQKLGLELPFVTAPMDKFSSTIGFDSLTLKDYKALVTEIMGGIGRENRAYFSALDPFSMNEIFLRIGTNKGESLGLEKEFKEILEELPYNTAATMGHNSGMGYYAELFLSGPLAFVLDQYEAGDIHEKIHAATNWRQTTQTKFLSVPRGWVRLSNYVKDENSTYGDSPMAEVIYHGLMNDPRGFERLEQYLTLVGNNIGKNATIALDIGPPTDSSNIYYSANNALLFYERKTAVPEKIIPFDQALAVSKNNGTVEIDYGGFENDIKEFEEMTAELEKINNEIDSLTAGFIAKNRQIYIQYRTNRLIAGQQIGEKLGIIPKMQLSEPITDPNHLLEVSLPEDIKLYFDSQIAQSEADLDREHRASLKKPRELNKPADESPYSQIYDKAISIRNQLTRYRSFQANIKVLQSLLNIRSGNNNNLYQMIIEKINNQETVNATTFPGEQVKLVENILINIQDVINTYRPPHVDSFFTGEGLATCLEAEKSDLDILAQKISEDAGITSKDGKLHKNDVSKAEQQIAQVIRLAEAAWNTELASDIYIPFDTMTLDQYMNEIEKMYENIKPSLICLLEERKLKVPQSEKTNAKFILQSLINLTPDSYADNSNMHEMIQKLTDELNNTAEMQEFFNKYGKFLKERETIIEKRNELRLRQKKLQNVLDIQRTQQTEQYIQLHNSMLVIE